MQASRKVLSQTTPKFLIAPRSSLDILSSAVRAGATFLFSAEKRDDCLNLLNNGVINAPVLGVPMTLALYNDLSSPLFSKHKFEAQNFMEGAKMALEQYHSIEGQVQNQILDQSLDQLKLFKSEIQDENESKESAQNNELGNLNPAGLTFAQTQSWLEKIEGTITEEKLENFEWKKQAEEEPDSLAAQFMNMVSPQFFTYMYKVFVTTATSVILNSIQPARYVSSEIENVALLSARAQIIPPLPVSKEEEQHLSDSEKQKNDDILNNIYPNVDVLPVAAQVEVVYDMSVEISPNGSTTVNDLEVDNTEDVENSDESNKNVTRLDVYVAVFEGWLHQSPDGSPLQWKLAMVRRPWEFGT